jgi:hypothetical protein
LSKTAVFTLGIALCRDGVLLGCASSVILQAGPRVEDGIAVAPRTFGRFACQLIAPDEHSGWIFAFDRRGRTRVVSQYRFPAGGDIGVESVGLVPPGSDRRGAAYLADLGAPGAPTPGTSPADAPWARNIPHPGPTDRVLDKPRVHPYSSACRKRAF